MWTWDSLAQCALPSTVGLAVATSRQWACFSAAPRFIVSCFKSTVAWLCSKLFTVLFLNSSSTGSFLF